MPGGAASHKNLVLILTRELASNIAVPLFLVDHAGTLVFCNEPAEEVLGMRFADAGELVVGQWGTEWKPEDLEGNAIDPKELPLVIAMREKRPSHKPMRIHLPQGTTREIAVTAFPLFAHRGDYVGSVAIFWDHQ
jgi:PAS domain-containing protein